MWLKLGVAKLLCICIDLTKFEENPEGLSFFCVDLTWNDPMVRLYVLLLRGVVMMVSEGIPPALEWRVEIAVHPVFFTDLEPNTPIMRHYS